jgi:peptidoglycan/xylan/chitin deacetylase (PgdA/CDA1 family)
MKSRTDRWLDRFGVLPFVSRPGAPTATRPLRRRGRTNARPTSVAMLRLAALLVPCLLLLAVAPQPAQPQRLQLVEGGVVRGPVDTRRIALVFTGHEFAEGAETILDVLARRKARASFFLTGAFLRDPAKAAVVGRMVAEGHYVGPHSDAHLLYCPWTGPKVTLVTRDEFTADLQRNVDALERHGVRRGDVTIFLPPYEWYNAEIADWTRSLGMTLVNYTPGTRSNADYTEENTRQFVSSEAIVESILRREREDPNGLNGFLLLLHVGAGPGRTDKFHARFAELMETLAGRGYEFVRIDTLLAPRTRAPEHPSTPSTPSTRAPEHPEQAPVSTPEHPSAPPQHPMINSRSALPPAPPRGAR